MSQVVLSGMLLLVDRKFSYPRVLYGLLVFAVLCYLLHPLLAAHPLGWLTGVLSTLVPGAFWLFSASLFDDHYEFPLWQPLLVALSVVLPAIFDLTGLPRQHAAAWLLVELPQALEFVFLALALYSVFSNWKDDLMTSRRKLRLWFCGIAGVFIFMLILARELLFAGAPWLEEAQYVATAVVLTGTNVMLLNFAKRLFRRTARSAIGPVIDDVLSENQAIPPVEIEDGLSEPGLSRQLRPVLRLMEEESVYREYGMTIGKLASATEIPEYRLRQLINSGLGYRNFNDFLNNFRIQEASRRLADPNEAKLPVLTIALDVGFRSISSFNKAFKDLHQLTPTAYRKKMLEKAAA